MKNLSPKFSPGDYLKYTHPDDNKPYIVLVKDIKNGHYITDYGATLPISLFDQYSKKTKNKSEIILYQIKQDNYFWGTKGETGDIVLVTGDSNGSWTKVDDGV